MLHVDASSIREHLPWPRMLAALEGALRGDVHAPLRTPHAVQVPGGLAGTLLMMPAWQIGHRLGVKLVTVFPGKGGARSVEALYVLFDARDGGLLAIFDGEELTARRTAGASAYAARFLARRDSRYLVMVGAGRQARSLVAAHVATHAIARVCLWSRNYQHALAAARELAAAGLPVVATDDLERAVRGADIVSCATLATSPLVQGAWLREGAHVDLVGAFKATMREADDDVMRRAAIVAVDQATAALAEGGDVVQAIAGGALTESAIAADLADFACGRHPGRTRDTDITVFKSVGFALEDLAAANAVYDALVERATTGGDQPS